MSSFDILVSLGMPIYNGENYLDRSIESLLQQSYKNFELIISNNASTDRSLAIIEYYASLDPRIKIFNQAEQIPIGKNFEYVLNKSAGKYFMWTACDDYWGKNFIYHNLENLEKNSNLIASISKAEAISIPGLKMGEESIQSTHSLIRRTIYLINPGINARQYSLFRSSSLKSLNMSNYSFVAADWALAMDMLCMGSYFRDEREIGFYKNLNGRSSNMALLKYETNNKWIGKFIPLHELTKYILSNHGIIFLPHLIGLNILFFCMIHRKLYNFLKILKIKYPKLN